MRITRRHAVLTLAGAAATATTLAACGGGDDGGKTKITYQFWASPDKEKRIREAIKKFEAKNPDITVRAEATPWDGYWDKMATMTAGGNAPEVIHMSERYILEYGSRGALADIEKVSGIDLKGLEKDVVDLGREQAGTLYAVPAGLNTLTLAINERVFEEAHVDVPDDTTWTWDDYYALSKKISETGPAGGAPRAAGPGRQKISETGPAGTDYGIGLETLSAWVRQAGESLYAKDGESIGFSEGTLRSYLEHMMTLKDSGALTPEQVSENKSLPGDAQPFATGKQAMGWGYSNQLAESKSADRDRLRLIMYPSHTGSADDNGMYYKGSEFYSISSKAKGPKAEAAAKFVNFMVNDPEAISAVGMSMGIPPNKKVVDTVSKNLDDLDKKVAEFITNLGQHLTKSSPGPSPAGAGNLQDLLERDVMDMLFGRKSLDETLKSLITAMNNELKA